MGERHGFQGLGTLPREFSLWNRSFLYVQSDFCCNNLNIVVVFLIPWLKVNFFIRNLFSSKEK